MTNRIKLAQGEVKAIPLTNLIPDPEQPRKVISKQTIKDRAASMKAAGQKTPITVRPNGTAGNYFVVMGHCRLKAAPDAGLKTLDCVLEKLTTKVDGDEDFSRLVSQMIENMERENLNVMDLCDTFHQIAWGFDGGMTSDDIHKELKNYGLSNPPSASRIRDIMRLKNLPAWAQRYVRENKLTGKHASKLLPIVELPNIVKSIKTSIDDEIKNKRTFTANMMAEDIADFMRHEYPSVKRNYIYEGCPLDSNDCTWYEIEKLKPEEKKELNTITVTDDDGDKITFATNLDAHKKQNAIAVEAIKQQRVKAETKKKTAATKKAGGDKKEKEVNLEPREGAFRDYVFAWLFDAIIKALSNVEKSEPIFDQLLAWCAFQMPVYPSLDWQDDIRIHRSGKPTRSEEYDLDDKAVIESGKYSLRCFVTTTDVLNGKDMDAIGARAVSYMNIEHRAFLAKHLGIDIANDFKIDDDYLKLYTKDGILNLIKDADIIDAHNPPLNKQPSTALRDILVTNYQDKLGCPVHVLTLIDNIVKDYNESIDESLNDIAASKQETEKVK